VSRKAKAFALELANTAVLTLLLFFDSVHKTVKFFLPINRLKSTINMLTPFYPKEETSLRVTLFLSLYKL
jgi:hypothetical protein